MVVVVVSTVGVENKDEDARLISSHLRVLAALVL